MLEWFSGSLQPYLRSGRTEQFGLRRETFDVNLAAPLEDKAPAFLTSWDNSVSAGQGSMALGLMDRQCPMGILVASVLLGATEWELYNSCQWTAVFLFFAAIWGKKSSGKLQLTCQNKFGYISKLANSSVRVFNVCARVCVLCVLDRALTLKLTDSTFFFLHSNLHCSLCTPRAWPAAGPADSAKQHSRMGWSALAVVHHQQQDKRKESAKQSRA